MILEGAQIDSFRRGRETDHIKSEPVFGGVYKLSAIKKNGELVPKMKISENVEKITNPGFKNVFRLYGKDNGKALGDVITLQENRSRKSTATRYSILTLYGRGRDFTTTPRELRVKIFDKGKCVYKSPSLQEIKQYCKDQVDTLWEETLRFENPQTYYVDLSKKLWDIKHELINKYSDDAE